MSAARTLWTAAFWKAAAERATKVAAYVLILKLGGDAVADGGFDVATAPWSDSFRFAAGAVVLSLLTSIGSDALTGGGPSLINAEVLADPDRAGP